MILRNRSALDGKPPKLSWTLAIEVMPSATAALMSNSLGLHRHVGPNNGVERPQRLLLVSLLFPTPTPL
jgi:hypothetical protein